MYIRPKQNPEKFQLFFSNMQVLCIVDLVVLKKFKFISN